ncbi:replication initiator [Kineococcus auxinigenes]|uniref:replication initiator n=1 Tax=unclassified Kineococcus TaxID=2621656 RepID=UPI003D7C3734
MIAESGVVVTTEMALTLAESAGVCVRPLLRKVTDRATGDVTCVPIPCGSTRESKCPACAAKAWRLRMHQCREGWHRTDDPLELLNPAEAELPVPEGVPGDESDTDDAEEEAEEEGEERRTRSTRRRQDVPDLPRVPMERRTVGRTFRDAKTGRVYQPSMFVTVTLPSYGRIVPGRGVPEDPRSYDYRRAALDALHFPKVVDRFWQNLRRVAGYQVQYFASVEPQKRLAPHLHAAIRGAIPRATLRQVARATYVSLWWPPHEVPVHTDPNRMPTWDPTTRRYLHPDTGRPLTSWKQALDRLDDELAIDPATKPAHVVRLGKQIDAKGLLGGTPDADRAVRYLCKYLTKDVASTYAAPDGEVDDEYEAHIDRLHAELRYLPCSPSCANWLRFDVEPQDPSPGMVPGRCPSRAHDREHLGLGGRRVLVSRQWTGKTLTEHKADRAEVVRQALEAAGIDPPEARRAAADVLHTDGRPRYVWEDVPLEKRDYATVIVASIAEHRRWKAEHEHAKTLATRRAGPPAPVDDRSATSAPGAA